MILRIFLVWFLFGLLVFYTVSTFDVKTYNTWIYFYYTWAKANDVLLMTTIYLNPKNSKLIRPALIVAIARLLWEVGAWALGLQSTNPIIVGSLFLILIAVCLFITIKETAKWQRQKL